MFRIVKGETTLATIMNPVWVKQQENGCFALSTADEATGVSVDGTVYHLDGREPIPDAETVVLSEISEAAYQAEVTAAQEAKQLQMDTALAELSILIANLMTPTA